MGRCGHRPLRGLPQNGAAFGHIYRLPGHTVFGKVIFLRRNGTIFYNMLLLTGVNFLLRGFSMVFGVYLSGRIGAEGLGLFQFIGTVGSLAMTLGLSGARVSAMYLCAEEYGARRLGGVRQAMRCCLHYGLIVSGLAAVLLWMLAEPIARTWIRNPDAVRSLRILAVFLPVNCVSSILTGYYTACNRVRSMIGVEVGERMLSLALTVLFLRGAGTDTSLCCAAVILGGNLAGVVATGVLLARYFREVGGAEAEAPERAMRGRLLRLAVPLAFSDYLRAALSSLEQFLIPWGLAIYSGSQSGSMAAYGVIHGMVFPILMFPATFLYSLSDLMVPELARRKATGNQNRIRQLTKRCLQMGLLFAGGVAGLMFVLAEPLGQLIYHSAEAGSFIRVFSPMVLMLYMDALVDGMEKGLGQQVATVRYNTITSFLDVVLLGLLLPRRGIGGYLFTFVVTHAVNFALSLRRLLIVTGYRTETLLPVKVLLCTVLSCAVCGLFPCEEPMQSVLLRGAVFLSAYLCLLILTRSFRKNDCFWLYGVLNPKRRIDNRAKEL